MHLTQKERQLVHRTNTLLGELLFTSDNPSTYSHFQKAEEAWQAENWQKKNWAVEPLEGGRFLLQSEELSHCISLQKTTGTWSEK